MTSLIIRKLQVETTMRYRLTPARAAVTKKTREKDVLVRMWRKGEPGTLLM